MIPTVSIKGDLKGLHRAMMALGGKHVPFASALALTRLAKGVERIEDEATVETFDTPTPFTQRAFAIVPATKAKPVAIVFPKDVQEAYLAPYVIGGDRSLGSKQSMIVPVDARTNQYGNLPKGALARYKGKPGVFAGKITFRKSGRTISGIWQRGATPRGARTKGAGEYGTKGDSQGKVGGVRSTLKLLVEFTDTTPAKKDLRFYERANDYLRRNAAREMDAAIRRALATQR